MLRGAHVVGESADRESRAREMQGQGCRARGVAGGRVIGGPSQSQ